MMQACANQGLT